MRIVPVPALNDNYAYLVIENGRAAVVDPSEAPPVLAALEKEGVKLVAIWATHHHADHVGGIEALLEKHGDLPVLGSPYDQEHRRIPRQTRALADGESFQFEGHRVTALHIPGHTLGAIALVVDDEAVFTGDMLFVAGCGRVFEGTMKMMSESLDRLRKLSKSARVYCGHEYTVKNLEFARTIEPDNRAIIKALDHAKDKRARNEPTVPSTIEAELATNPFLRFDLPEVAKGLDPVASFTRIRAAKDTF